MACGPPGLTGGRNALYRNRGDGTFEDVSEKTGITSAKGTYGLGVSTLDFDGDGWVDLYVANDSNPSALYRNNHDGTFTDIGVTSGCAYSQDGKPQAGMGVAIGDYDRNGTMDVFKTNFAGDTSTLYANTGRGSCEDRTFAAGIGLNTRWLGWGTGWIDLDNDGWLDLFLTNGHVYPEVSQLKTEAGYKQRKVIYRNLGNGAVRRHQRAPRIAGDRSEGRTRLGVRRLRQRRADGRRDRERQRPAGPLSPERRVRPSLDDADAGRHEVEPERDRRTGPLRRRRRHAVAGGPRRRQLHVAERFPRALRPRRRRRASNASRCGGPTATRRSGRTCRSMRFTR